jgi:hypothetical protein
MVKKEMVDLIVKMLFNINEVSGVYAERIHRGYMRLSKVNLEGDYRRALRIMGEKHQANIKKEAGESAKQYKALDSKGFAIITVLAQSAFLARGEVMEQLSRNHSRQEYIKIWRKGHCCLQTETGIKLYWCHDMERYVTIPEDY